MPSLASSSVTSKNWPIPIAAKAPTKVGGYRVMLCGALSHSRRILTPITYRLGKSQ